MITSFEQAPGLLSELVPLLKAEDRGGLVVRSWVWSVSLGCVRGLGAPAPVLEPTVSVVVVCSFGVCPTLGMLPAWHHSTSACKASHQMPVASLHKHYLSLSDRQVWNVFWTLQGHLQMQYLVQHGIGSDTALHGTCQDTSWQCQSSVGRCEAVRPSSGLQ